MQERDAGRDRERITRDQPDEDGRGRGEKQRVGAPRKRDGERSEEHGRYRKAAGRGVALLEVARDERGVDPGADRAGENDDVPLEDGAGDHLTSTPPSMSIECSVQT